MFHTNTFYIVLELVLQAQCIVSTRTMPPAETLAAQKQCSQDKYFHTRHIFSANEILLSTKLVRVVPRVLQEREQRQ